MAVRDVVGRAADDVVDAARRFGAALRQAAHLLRHHRKTTPGVAGLGGLDRGIERQDVGAKRQVVDQLDDLADLAAAPLQRLHAFVELLHLMAGPRGVQAHALHHRLGLVDPLAAGVELFDVAAHALQDLFDRLGRSAGAPGQVLIAAGDLTRGMRGRRHALAHHREQVGQTRQRLAQRMHRLRHLVAPPGLRTRAQVAAGHAADLILELVQAAVDDAVERQQHIHRQRHDHQRRAQHPAQLLRRDLTAAHDLDSQQQQRQQEGRADQHRLALDRQGPHQPHARCEHAVITEKLAQTAAPAGHAGRCAGLAPKQHRPMELDTHRMPWCDERVGRLWCDRIVLGPDRVPSS